MTTISTNLSVATLVNSDQPPVADMFFPVTMETLNNSSVSPDTIAPNPNLPDWALFTSNLLPASSYTGGNTIFPYQFSLASPEDLAFISFDWRSVRNGKVIIAVSGATLSHSASPFIDVSSSWQLGYNLNPLIAPYGYSYLSLGGAPGDVITGTINEFIFGKYAAPAPANLISGLATPIPISGGFYPLDGSGALSANLVTNGDFSAGTTGWYVAPGWSLVGSELVGAAGSNPSAQDLSTASIADKFYKIGLDATGSGDMYFSGSSVVNIAGPGRITCYVKAVDTGAHLEFWPGAAGMGVTNITVQEVLGSLSYSNTSVGVRTIDISTVAMSFVAAMSHNTPDISTSIINPSLANLVSINPAYLPGSINPQTHKYNFDNVLRQLLVTPASTTPFTITIDIVTDNNITLSSNAYTSSLITDRVIPSPYTAPIIVAGDFIIAPNAQTTGVMFQGGVRTTFPIVTDTAVLGAGNAVTVFKSDLSLTYTGVSSFSAIGCCGAGLPAYSYGFFIGGRSGSVFSQKMWTVSATVGDIQTLNTILPMSVVAAAAAGCEDKMICYGGSYGSPDGTGLSPSDITVTERSGTAFTQYSQLNNTTDVTGAVFKCDSSNVYNIVDYTSSGKRKNSAGVGNFSNTLPTGTTTNPLCHFVGGDNGKECIAIDNYTVMNKNLDALVLNKSMTRPQTEIVGCALSNRAAYMSGDIVNRGAGFINREYMLSIVDITGTRLVAASFLNMFGIINGYTVGSGFGFGPRGVFLSRVTYGAVTGYKTSGYVIDADGNWTDTSTYLQSIADVGNNNKHGKYAAYASF